MTKVCKALTTIGHVKVQSFRTVKYRALARVLTHNRQVVSVTRSRRGQEDRPRLVRHAFAKRNYFLARNKHFLA